MIQNTFVPKQQIKAFLTQKAPAMLALVLASTVILTGSGVQKGITADEIIEYEIEDATEKMAIIQNALEQYRNEHGGYPSIGNG